MYVQEAVCFICQRCQNRDSGTIIAVLAKKVQIVFKKYQKVNYWLEIRTYRMNRLHRMHQKLFIAVHELKKLYVFKVRLILSMHSGCFAKISPEISGLFPAIFAT